ncbi:membrane protein [Erwinia tracheiphila]|uniref:Membrane protein n=1 Tax=Erwinia tracheiphila TaxID=65700 RepID=A0A0M2KIY5_9GAMM|nr:putative phage membrane protein [Erwinia tracheiphila PSU-1]KKF37282.1 membrane protein [Erwinia tracheiphila]
MDTVEQLNGTYFYAGRSNLSVSEMLFIIFCELLLTT